MENPERRKHSQPQIRPIVRNLKAPAPPKFSQDIYDTNNESTPTFKVNTFVQQSMQKVRISHYEKGIYMFYVQLEMLDSQLQNLLTKIQSTNLVQLKCPPSQIGVACLAKHNRKIHRVAIAKIFNGNQESFLCHFVDYGYSATVKLENLFHIPDAFLSHPTFALQFTFAGLQNVTFKCPVQEINCYFKDVTENKLLTLKCVPNDGPPISQYCQLYDKDKDILEILKLYNPMDLHIPQPTKLEFKKDILVKVCYVQSVKEFYIHLQVSDILFKYDTMYDDLQKQLPSSPIVSKLRINQFVGVNIDSEYYRGKVVEIAANNKMAHVEIIDFGIVEEVHSNNIRVLPSKFLHIPIFSYRCCLDGFEGSEVSENITTQFEMFCSDVHEDRKLFSMNINRYDVKLGYLARLEDISVCPSANVNRILLKNSRPLAETITLENARKRHKETQKKNKDSSPNKTVEVAQEITPNTTKINEKNRSNSQRGRGNQTISRGVNRSSPASNNRENHNNNNEIANNKRQRTHFDKSSTLDSNANSIGGTYYKTQREANIWSDMKQQKSGSDWNQAKNISKEQISDSDWNETSSDSSPKKNQQKSKKSSNSNKKSDSNQNNNNSNNNKQKSPPKQDKSPNNKQKSPVCEENVKTKQSSEKVNNDKLKCGWVSTLINTNEAFVHFEEHIDGLEKILDELYMFYEGQKGSTLKDIKPSTICAYKSQDGNWYRCEILSVDKDICRLRNQEYGNIESVPNSALRYLDARFKKYGKLVEKAYFSIKPNDPQYDNKQLLKEMLEAFNEGAKELNFKLIKPFKDGHILDAFDPQTRQNIMDVLVTKKKMAKRINETELMEILEKIEKIEEEELKVIEESVSKIVEDPKVEVVSHETPAPEPVIKSDRIPAKLTALTSPNDFYLTRVDLLQHLDQFHTDIQILAPALQPLIDFSCGTYCLAQQPFDNHWYRAKIIDSDDTIMTVRCIDNGKTFSIDNKLSMKTMPEQLQQKTFFGVPCSLAVRLERKSEEDATDLMLKLVEKDVEYKILLSTKNINYIELFHDDQEISELLVAKNYAQRFEIFKSGSGYTSHINSLSDFYVQLEVEQLKLDLIATIMDQANGKFKAVEDAKVGQIVAAKYPDDDGWYRSKIESVEVDGFIVTFMDYGNSCLVKEIGVIDESIAELPAMSKKCCLYKPKNIVSFSEAAEKEFVKITANGETIVHVKVLKAGDVTEVELFCDNQNIIDKLIPLCKLESDKLEDGNDI